MPNSDVHRYLHYRAGKVLLPVSMGVGYLCGGWYMGLWAGAGYVLHRWFDQDLDQKGTTTAEADWARTIVLAPVQGLSALYAQIVGMLPSVFGFKRGHRSFWSHFPPVGALLRLTVFWIPFYLWFKSIWVDSLMIEFLGLYIGLQIADWVHSVADWLEDSNSVLIYKVKKRVQSKGKKKPKRR